MRSSSVDEQRELFPVLWICALLFQLIASAEIQVELSSGLILSPVLQIFLFAAAIVFLVLNRSLALFALILAGQILTTWLMLPVVPNHRLLCALINCVILYDIYNHRAMPNVESFTFARAMTVLIYFWTGFDKINTDHLDPSLSCATKFLREIGEYFPVLDIFNTQLAASAGMLLEVLFAGAFLAGGVVAGFAFIAALLFHFLLAFHLERHFIDFSSTMFALLSLFIPPQIQASHTLFFSQRFRFVLALGFVTTFCAIFFHRQNEALAIIYPTRVNLWGAFSLLFLLDIIFGGRNRKKIWRYRVVPLSAFSSALLGIAFLNCLSPYLGLKTRTAFDMYSNLQVEDGHTNHLLIPDYLLGNIFTKDLVQPIFISGAEVRSDVVDLKRRLVRFEVMSLLYRTPGLKISVIDEDGEITDYSRPEEVYRDGWTGNLILRKLLSFRPVEKAGQRASCQW